MLRQLVAVQVFKHRLDTHPICVLCDSLMLLFHPAMILPEEVPEVAELVARLNGLDLETAVAAGGVWWTAF